MTRPANSMRGEHDFLIEGIAHVLRPSFEALVAAEEELGSLFALVERASNGSLTLVEMTALVWHCLPSANRPGRELVGKAVLAMGMVEAITPVRAILAEALRGRI